MKSGDRFGTTILEEPLGAGRLAEVWAARIEWPGDFVKPVALKLVARERSRDPDFVRRFQRAMKIASALAHPNLVAVTSFGVAPSDAPADIAGRCFVITERVEGHDLAELQALTEAQGRPLPVELAVFVACELLKALHFVHSRALGAGEPPLAHGAVSPGNILFGLAGEVKLADFGLGPELGLGRAPAALPSDDLRAAGIILWELLAARRFPPAPDAALPALDARRRLPTGLEAITLRLVGRNPKARFPSAAAALEALRPFTGNAAGAAGPLRMGEHLLALFSAAGATPAEGAGGPVPTRPLARPRDPAFPLAVERRRRQAAEDRYAAAVAFGAFSGSLEDWFRKHAQESCWDVFTETQLPADYATMIAWPRLANVGWESPLLLAWHGTYPWGSDGYWVAEDPQSDEMMVIFAASLGRGDFQGVTPEQWRRWWLDHEIDPETELPGGAAIPVSRRARALVPPGARPPVTGDEWNRILRIESERDERDTLRRLRRVEVLSSPAPSANSSWWKRLLRISAGAGHLHPLPKQKR
jgi:hypothetical protein